MTKRKSVSREKRLETLLRALTKSSLSMLLCARGKCRECDKLRVVLDEAAEMLRGRR